MRKTSVRLKLPKHAIVCITVTVDQEAPSSHIYLHLQTKVSVIRLDVHIHPPYLLINVVTPTNYKELCNGSTSDVDHTKDTYEISSVNL